MKVEQLRNLVAICEGIGSRSRMSHEGAMIGMLDTAEEIDLLNHI